MRNLKLIYLLFLVTFSSYGTCQKSDSSIEDDRKKIVMRKVGHAVLLLANDSTSLVQPILKEGEKYRVLFSTEFGFLPDDLIKAVDSVITQELPNQNYLVQVENCTTKEIVYSYEIEIFPQENNEISCQTREQPEACYEIIIQFITHPEQNTMLVYVLISLVIIILIIGRFVYSKNKKDPTIGKIKLGAYLYDPKKMTLTLVESVIELTSKESELLNLLYESVNDTVDRETILNKVWGDEGDYVGRTLDVFISKLRKKLEHDTSVELKNIRGIGYKLIVEE